MNNLRLLLWEDCNRDCPGCCNKGFDLDALPVCTDFWEYDQILLTGGEPMLRPYVVHEIIRHLRRNSTAEIIVYTAMPTPPAVAVAIAADGMTVTLHKQSDYQRFLNFVYSVRPYDRSFRANVFKGVQHVKAQAGWDIRQGYEWIEDCPVPDGEVFMRWRGIG